MVDPLTIVVVEDDQGLNELIRRRLVREGHHCEGFGKGRDAVEWLKDGHAADLMIMDLMLPDSTGDELISMLRRNNISIPFLVATGQGSEAVAVRMLKKGAKDYLVKNSEFLNALPSAVENVWREIQLQRLLEKAREQIRSQNAILSAVHQFSPDGILVVDAEDRIVSYNRRLINMFRMEEKDVESNGRHFLEKLSEKLENGSKFLVCLNEMNPAYQGLLMDDLLLGNASFELYTNPMREEDTQTNGRIWYFRDITLHREAQREKEKARIEAEQNVRIRSQFFAVVTHDVKTPLNSITGFLSLLEAAGVSTDQKKYIDIIKSSSEHLLMLINDILDLTRIEQGVLELNPGIADLRDLMAECINIFLPVSRESGVELQCLAEKDVPESITTDVVRLKQILINLLGNAMKFTHKGHVRLSCRRLGEKMLEFTVEDTGTGIPEDVQEMIFVPFTQASSEVHTKYGGSGLGLSISKQLVERFGGKICLQSKIGSGSVFVFSVPVKLEIPKSCE